MGGALWTTGFGAIWTTFCLHWIHDLVTGGPVPDLLGQLTFIAVFLPIGLWLSWMGISLFFRRTLLRIDDATVQFEEKGMGGTKTAWTEPLSAFRGVLPTREPRRGRNDTWYTDYVISLKHAEDPERDVELYTMSARGRIDGDPRAESEHRRETEAFARLFGLPVVVEEEDGGFAVRAVPDLDKSLGERMAEEGLEAPSFDPELVPDGSPLEVRRIAEGYAFEASLMRDVRWGLLFGPLGLWLLYLYFKPGPLEGEGSEWVVPVVGGMFVAASLLIVFVSLFRVERLEVSSRGVRAGRVRPGSWLPRDGPSSLTPDEIEEVGVRKNAYGRFRVTISSDRGSLTWGKHLSSEERGLVRDAVIDTLTA